MLQFGMDFEITNRCNAHCSFCPRDATPHQGLMSPEVFTNALERTLEVKAVVTEIDPEADVKVSLCGFGEPLLHKQTPVFARRVREAGLDCTLASNAALLDERRASAIIEAGVQRIFVNIGEIDDDYEKVYALPFEKTRDNIVRFIEMAGDECETVIVLVNHRADKAHVAEMEQYWRQYGVEAFIKFDIMNRGGSLYVDHMQYDDLGPEIARAQAMLDERGGEAVCGHPFWQTFIGYDGMIYLCCGDWEKRSPVGSVFDADSVLNLSSRLDPVRTREPICKTCNHDQLNHLAGEIRAQDRGVDDAADTDKLADAFVAQGVEMLADIEEFESAAQRIGLLTHKRIPVRSL